jgi:hypothetical protein
LRAGRPWRDRLESLDPGASVSDTKPTPRCSSSWSVASRSVTEWPQRSNCHTSTTISRRRAASSSFCEFSLGRPGADLTDVRGDGPVAPSGIFAHGATLHGQRLLIVCGNAGIRTARNIFDCVRAWPKTLSHFAFGKACLAAISEYHPSMAAVDHFQPMQR